MLLRGSKRLVHSFSPRSPGHSKSEKVGCVRNHGDGMDLLILLFLLEFVLRKKEREIVISFTTPTHPNVIDLPFSLSCLCVTLLICWQETRARFPLDGWKETYWSPASVIIIGELAQLVLVTTESKQPLLSIQSINRSTMDVSTCMILVFSHFTSSWSSSSHRFIQKPKGH